MGKSKDAPAELIKDLIERDLMEKYHWTPQQIAKLSYKWIQKYYLFDKVRKDAIETKNQLQDFKNQNSGSSAGSSSRGRNRKMIVTGDNVVPKN